MINSSPAPAAVSLQAIKVGCFMFCNPRCVMVFKPLKQGKTRCHLKIYETLNPFTLKFMCVTLCLFVPVWISLTEQVFLFV